MRRSARQTRPTCPGCGQTFMPHTLDERTCSTACARRVSQVGEDNPQVTNNLNLIWVIVQKMPSARRLLGSPEDAFQAGAVGLLKAARTYDPASDVRFSTYACRCVKNEIIRALMTVGGTVRVKSRRALRTLSTGAPANDLDQETLDDARRAMKVLSLDQPLRHRGDNRKDLTLAHTLPDHRTTHPGIGADDSDLAQALRDTLPEVHPAWRTVIERHFGLDGRAPETLSQIGMSLGVTRERVRQKLIRGLESLKEKTERRLKKRLPEGT